jgi:hypothetical protein
MTTDSDMTSNHALSRKGPGKTTVASDGKNVVVRLYINGRDVAHLTDGATSPAILTPGQVGIRGDNTEAEFKNFRVTTA